MLPIYTNITFPDSYDCCDFLHWKLYSKILFDLYKLRCFLAVGMHFSYHSTSLASLSTFTKYPTLLNTIHFILFPLRWFHSFFILSRMDTDTATKHSTYTNHKKRVLTREEHPIIITISYNSNHNENEISSLCATTVHNMFPLQQIKSIYFNSLILSFFLPISPCIPASPHHELSILLPLSSSTSWNESDSVLCLLTIKI